MEFKYGGQKVVLRGTQKSDMEWLGSQKFQHNLHKSAQLFALRVCLVSAPLTLSSVAPCSPELQQLLHEYADIFKEPKTLPPHREYDHRIMLKPGSSPVNVRPYKYPGLQKDVKETALKEMVYARVVRPSHSPYYSPIVLVKKKRMVLGDYVWIIGS